MAMTIKAKKYARELGVLSFDKFKTTVQIMDAKEVFPTITDPMILWHFYRFKIWTNKTIRSFFSHMKTLDSEGKSNYKKIIKGWFRKYPDIKKSLKKANIELIMAFVIKFAPRLSDWAQVLYLKRDPNGYARDTLAANKALKTDKAKFKHIEGVKAFILKYAPEGWQEKLSPKLAAKFVPLFYAQEIEDIQRAEIEAKQAQGTKIIGMLIVGAFGLFLLTGLRKKKAA